MACAIVGEAHDGHLCINCKKMGKSEFENDCAVCMYGFGGTECRWEHADEEVENV